MSMTIVIILTMTLLILLNGLFVAAEFTVVTVRQTRLKELSEEGHALARLLWPILENRQALADYVTTCQLGISVTLLTLGAFSQQTAVPLLTAWLTQSPYMAQFIALPLAILFVLLVLTALQVIFGELIPKAAAIHYAENLTLATTLPVIWLQPLLRPMIRLLQKSYQLLLTVVGLRHLHEQANIHTPQQIEQFISESHESGLLADEEQRLLRNAFRLRDLTARQVMIPRTQLVTAPIETSVFDLMELATTAGFSRIPLYQKSIDNIVGFVHIKNLLKLYLQDKPDTTDILHEALHVPETLSVAEVWDLLNTHHQYLAIVFDEYGGTAGLITFEDLLEEIFGEFQDEFDDELPLVSADNAGRVYLRSDLLVADVNEYLNLKLPKDDADTIGGLVFSLLGRPPKAHDEVLAGEPEILIRVESLEGRRITEVSLLLSDEVDTQIGEWEVSKHE